jgi:hypothetical protein
MAKIRKQMKGGATLKKRAADANDPLATEANRLKAEEERRIKEEKIKQILKERLAEEVINEF